MKRVWLAAVLAAALSGPVQAADPVDTAAYDLLFRQGTLDSFAKGDVLHYSRAVTNTLVASAAGRDSGEIELRLVGGTPPEARLRFVQGEKHRELGGFPASVGNPVIMYFVETVVRDMAESTGGSPFYIRNRVKEALVSPAEITREGGAVTVVMHPFEDDANAERMQDFGELELTVVMSDAVPGWYRSLAAEAGATYRSEMVFEGTAE